MSAPTLRGSYGVLIGVGSVVLAVGLVLPFVVADPARNDASARNRRASPSLAESIAVDLPDAADAEATAGPAIATGGAAPVAQTAAPGSTAPRGASDVGITADTIKLGFLIPDVSGLGEESDEGYSFGESVGDPGEQWKAFVDDLNARGGIGGRKIEPVYRRHNLIDPDDMRAACVFLTEQAKVFAVLNASGFYGDPILCVTEQHKTPFIGQAGEGDDFYQRSKGLYFSTSPSKDRILKNLVAQLDRDKTLKGRKIGLLDGEGIDSIPVDRSLLPTLKKYGYALTHHTRIANELSAAQAQIPLEIQQMRSKGVDLILPVTNLVVANVWAQEADSQRYTPAYVLSDFASGATDLYSTAMPASFEGNIAYTALRTGEVAKGFPEAAHDAACRATFEKRVGRALDRSNSEYYSTVTACGILKVFERAAGAAGSTLTRPALSKALQAVGSFDVPYSGPGSFTAGKFDAPDAARRVSWLAGCRCWRPIDGFRRTPF